MDEICIYEDSVVRVLYRRGEGVNLICTFGDALAAANFNRVEYNGKRVIEHLNLPAIAFLPKGTDWYPSDVMIKALEAVHAAVDFSQFQRIIGYGSSMGGYGALKYAQRLKATHVIANCPQWSIDPAQANGINPGYGSYFHEKMRGHGVRREELSSFDKGIYIAFDPLHEGDNFHANSYLAQNDRITLIPLRHARHDIPKILIGTQYFSALINAIVADDENRIRSLIVKKYRSYHDRYFNTIQAAIKRHPDWVVESLVRNTTSYLTADDAIDGGKIEPLVDQLIRKLMKIQHYAAAKRVARLKALRDLANNQADKLVDRLVWEENICFLRTKYETLICYDEKQLNFCALPYPEIIKKGLQPVLMHRFKGRHYLSVKSGNAYKICVMTHNKKIVLQEVSGLNGIACDGYILELNGRQLAMRSSSDKLYCSVSAGGLASWSKPWARSNERFELISP